MQPKPGFTPVDSPTSFCRQEHVVRRAVTAIGGSRLYGWVDGKAQSKLGFALVDSLISCHSQRRVVKKPHPHLKLVGPMSNVDSSYDDGHNLNVDDKSYPQGQFTAATIPIYLHESRMRSVDTTSFELDIRRQISLRSRCGRRHQHKIGSILPVWKERGVGIKLRIGHYTFDPIYIPLIQHCHQLKGWQVTTIIKKLMSIVYGLAKSSLASLSMAQMRPPTIHLLHASG